MSHGDIIETTDTTTSLSWYGGTLTVPYAGAHQCPTPHPSVLIYGEPVPEGSDYHCECGKHWRLYGKHWTLMKRVRI